MDVQSPNTEGLTFEKVWASLRDVAERFKETDRQFKETDRKFKETDRQIKETDRKFKETDKQFKETDRKISRLGSRIGDLIEHFAASNILEKFRELGYTFTCASRNNDYKDENGRYLAEVDIRLENGEYVMIVEVKTLLSRDDVKEHIKRMEILREYLSRRKDRRKYLGAVAAALIKDDRARDYALGNGFYVVEQRGDNVRVTAPEQVGVW
jgi:hypothetical protein